MYYDSAFASSKFGNDLHIKNYIYLLNVYIQLCVFQTKFDVPLTPMIWGLHQMNPVKK